MTLQEILESVKSGSVSVEEAERILKKESYEEMGYAKLDTSRKARTGFAEVIYCSNKADEHLLNIFERLYREDGEVFGTRASQHQYELVKEKFPEVQYDPVSRILKIEKPDKVHTLFKDEIETKLWPLPVKDLFMCGKKTTEELNKIHIYTIKDLANTNQEILNKKFKSQGTYLKEASYGIDNTPVIVKKGRRQSISTTTKLPHDETDTEKLKGIIPLIINIKGNI